MSMLQIINCLELGFIYSLVAFAVYLSFKVINFTDLTVDGSFSLGASVMATALSNDLSILIAIIFSIMAGVVAGIITAYLNVKYKIMEILSGILVMTALYSINLRIMGKPNISLINESMLSEAETFITILLIMLIVSIILIIFLKTEIGFALRSIGQNPKFARACGINIGKMTIITLGICNGLVALSGALLVLMQNFADISMGLGTIVIGLASVIIGEKISSSRSIITQIFSLIAGAVIYRLVILLALNSDFLKLEASDLNLISALLLASVMIVPIYFKKR